MRTPASQADAQGGSHRAARRRAEVRAEAGVAGKDKRGEGVDEHGAQRRREEETEGEEPGCWSKALRRRKGRRR